MKKIRIANTAALVTKHYSILSELPFVQYEENQPLENARKLHEGEVDVALIPTAEFAVHGAYLGLDFGLGSVTQTDCLLLYAPSPMQRLQTVFLYESSSSTALMLEILFREKWKTAPRFVHDPKKTTPADLHDDEGMLLRHEGPVYPPYPQPYVEDLGRAWHDLTGKPFIYLIWAARPDVLTVEQERELQNLFHRASSIRSYIAASYASQFDVPQDVCVTFVQNNFQSYLDRHMIEGLNTLFSHGADLGLLPRMNYQNTTFTLLGGRSGEFHERRAPEILEDCVKGRRISIEDAVRLAVEAGLPDLTLAAEVVRQKHSTDRFISYVLTLTAGDLENREILHSRVEKAEAEGATTLVLCPPDLTPESFAEYLELIHEIKSRHRVSLEALSVENILALSGQLHAAPRSVVARLLTAGLDGLAAGPGGMLVDRLLRRRGAEAKAADYLDIIKWFHSLGGKSTCSLRLDANDSWEMRFVHLQKLRALQDLNPGFRSLTIESAPDQTQVAMEERLRAVSISRLFLDNVPLIQESGGAVKTAAGVISIALGGNELRIPVSSEQPEQAAEIARVLRGLNASGIEFQARTRDRSHPEEVH